MTSQCNRYNVTDTSSVRYEDGFREQQYDTAGSGAGDVGLAAVLQRELQAAIAAGLTGVSDIGDCRQGTALECPAPEARQVHAYANTGAFFNMINPTDGGKPTNYLATDN